MYINNLVGDVKANPRVFYRYINSQKKDTQGTQPIKRQRGTGIADSEIEQAEEFIDLFIITDVFNKSEHSEVPFLNTCRLVPFVVSKEGVTKFLKGLNPSLILSPFLSK